MINNNSEFICDELPLSYKNKYVMCENLRYFKYEIQNLQNQRNVCAFSLKL